MYPNLPWSPSSLPEALMRTATHGTTVVSTYRKMTLPHGQIDILATAAGAVTITSPHKFHIQAMWPRGIQCVPQPIAAALQHLILQTQDTQVRLAHRVLKWFISPFSLHQCAIHWLDNIPRSAIPKYHYFDLFHFCLVDDFPRIALFCLRCVASERKVCGVKTFERTERKIEGRASRMERGNTNLLWIVMVIGVETFSVFSLLFSNS